MTDKKDYIKGMQAAIFCSALWGVLPLYWQALRPIGSGVIIFYRIFLVGLVCFAASAKIYGIKEVLKPWQDKRLVLRNISAGLLITFNWSLYIWAVNADFVIQTCIGYYIEPNMVTSYFLEAIRKAKPIPESPAPITAIFLCFAGRLYLLGLLREASSITDFSSRLICSGLSIIWRMQAFSQYAGQISHTIAGKATLSRIDL